MDFNDLNVPADKVFAEANQLRNDGSQPSDEQQANAEEQRVPYDRFKEVNDERKRLQDQVDAFIRMQAQATTSQAQDQSNPTNPYQQQFNQPNQFQQQPPVNQTVQQAAQTGLFSDEELESFEQDIVLDPKNTIKRLADAIMQRGVDARTKDLEQKFEQRFTQLNGQLLQQTLPGVIQQFKSQRFSQDMQAEAAKFDEVLKTVDPSVLANPAALENIRLAAIGFVADQRRQNPQAYQQNQASFFTETPGGLPGGFGGLGINQNPNVPPEVAAFAQRMGIDPKDAVNMYAAMNKTGVFR